MFHIFFQSVKSYIFELFLSIPYFVLFPFQSTVQNQKTIYLLLEMTKEKN